MDVDDPVQEARHVGEQAPLAVGLDGQQRRGVGGDHREAEVAERDDAADAAERVQADDHDHVDQRLDGAGLERRAGEGRDQDRGDHDDRAQDDRRAEALAEDLDVHQTLVACREIRPCGRSRKIAITPR
jgi:hypothetical protein